MDDQRIAAARQNYPAQLRAFKTAVGDGRETADIAAHCPYIHGRDYVQAHFKQKLGGNFAHFRPPSMPESQVLPERGQLGKFRPRGAYAAGPSWARKFGTRTRKRGMDFQLSEEQRAIQEVARKFAGEELLPHAARWDEEKIFPVETLRAAADLGFAGIYVSEVHGGSGLGRLEAALIFEELAAADPSTAAYLSIHNMVAWMIARFGTEAQRERYLPSLLRGEKLASYCLTEPNSGSNAASLRTRAVR